MLLYSSCSDISTLTIQASGLLGRQVRHVFYLDGWKAVGTGLSRINPPEVIKLDILDAKEVERVLNEVKYEPTTSERKKGLVG